MVSLHEINEWGVCGFVFDGVIWVGSEKRYVQKIPFETLSIGGYGEIDYSAASSDLWIQSHEGKKFNIWYRLRRPAEEYRRYHEPFLWMAEMARHVINYLSGREDVTLNHFRARFHEWLDGIYGLDQFHHRWKHCYRRQDFRHVVVSQANFLWCQATQVDENLQNQPLWSEVHPRSLSAIPESLEDGTNAQMFADSYEGDKIVSRRKTTVTPYVYECFKHLPWAKFLYCQSPSRDQANGQRIDPLGYQHSGNLNSEELDLSIIEQPKFLDSHLKISIKVGDVVALPLDNMSTWKSYDAEWLGYVQSITETHEGRRLGLLWLYRPSDTQCLRVPYPFSRELFLSDHCNCGDAPIYCQEVIRKPRVAFFSGPTTEDAEFFIRQRYAEGDGAWKTLQQSDFLCECGQRKSKTRYSKGETILVNINKILEPAVLVGYEPDDQVGKIKIRLLRRRRYYDDMKAEPNELVLTHQFRIIDDKDVSRECQVRFYSEEEREKGTIPAPYNRQGMGDFYFITAQGLQDDESGLRSLKAPWPALLTEGWDPRNQFQRPMKGLDIFCGGGSFGRGLEEGGAVKFDWAVDWYSEAIHTYKANLRSDDETQLFRGSVNDYLTQAMQGKGSSVIAKGDQVEIIAAGSPCQGFSVANPLRGNDRSLLNVSMIASVVAFVDYYRPKYAILENVKGMAAGPDTENILALVISALVGMGYQARTFALDAWNFGSPQSRARIFISIAAPGLTPLPEPPHTHSHPEMVMSASLGKLANGLRSSSRYVTQTPFKYITAAEATKDLPTTDGRTSSIPFPAHRISKTLSTLHRVQIGSIPRFPCGGTFITATREGYMPQAQIDAFPWSNEVRSKHDAKGWRRVKRGALMPTVMTEPRPDDGACGTCLHWDDERLLTVMEVRRGQGIPDDEVLVGLHRDQWKIVGNGVARPVALAVGISLRKAWLAPLANSAATTAGSLGTNEQRNPSSVDVDAILGRAARNHQPAEMIVDSSTLATSPQALSSTSPNRQNIALLNKIRRSTEDLQHDGRVGYHMRETSEVGLNPLEPIANSGADHGLGGDHAASGDDELELSHPEAISVRSDRDCCLSLEASAVQCHITQETTVSKVTVTTTTRTTTILGERIESSPEL